MVLNYSMLNHEFIYIVVMSICQARVESACSHSPLPQIG